MGTLVVTAVSFVMAASVGQAFGSGVLWFAGPTWSPNLLISQPYLIAGSVERKEDMYADAAEYARDQCDALHRSLFHREGSSATVTVMEDPRHLVLRVDGKPDASSVSDISRATLRRASRT